MVKLLSSKRKTQTVFACEQDITLTELSARDYYQYSENLNALVGTQENPINASISQIKKLQGELIAMSLMPNYPDNSLNEVHNSICELSMDDFKILYDAASKLFSEAMRVDSVIVKKTQESADGLP